MRRTGPLGHCRSEINKGDYIDRFGCTTGEATAVVKKMEILRTLR
jgi:hypothetical protein